jgi:hypothetical protein
MRNTLAGKVRYYWHVVVYDESCDALWSGLAPDEGMAAATTYLRVHGGYIYLTALRDFSVLVCRPRIPVDGVRCNDAPPTSRCRARMR